MHVVNIVICESVNVICVIVTGILVHLQGHCLRQAVSRCHEVVNGTASSVSGNGYTHV